MPDRHNHDSNWYADFVGALDSLLREKESAGVLAVDRLVRQGGKVTTVLQVPPGSGQRYGRVVDLDHFRSLFVPDRPTAVAEAWFQSIYPPDGTPAQAVDGVMWHEGERPQ
jgi:hypothetical protein